MSNVNFVLEYLDVSGINLGTSLTQATADGTASFTSNAGATISLAASLLNDVFIFQTDASDVTDAIVDDIKYGVNNASSNWPSVADLAYSSAVVGTNAIVGTAANEANTIAFDLVRSHVKDVFGFAGATDFVSNEEDMRDAVVAVNSDIRDTIVTLLASSGSADTPVTDSTTDGSGNVTRALIEQLAADSDGRKRLTVAGTDEAGANSMVPTSGNRVQSAGGVDFFKFMFIPGDSLKIRVTYSPKSTESTPITGLGTIQDRSYTIQLNLTA